MDLLHLDYPVCRRQGADFGAFMGTKAIQLTKFAAAIMTYLSVSSGTIRFSQFAVSTCTQASSSFAVVMARARALREIRLMEFFQDAGRG